MRNVLAVLGALTLVAIGVATLYGIAMYRELQRPASWMDSQEGAA